MKLKTKFQDEIFESGEVVDAFCYGEADRIRVNAYANDNERGEYIYYYNSIKDFTDHWEDVPEEPKKHYEILGIGYVVERDNEDDIFRCARQREIGNYFETKEEAEAALEKLKAFKRLKDKGFKFEGIKEDYTRILESQVFRSGKRYLQFNKSEDEEWMKENWDDLDLLFSGEDD